MSYDAFLSYLEIHTRGMPIDSEFVPTGIGEAANFAPWFALQRRQRASLQILSLGCGAGGVEAILAFYGFRVYAFDANPARIDYCKKIVPKKKDILPLNDHSRIEDNLNFFVGRYTDTGLEETVLRELRALGEDISELDMLMYPWGSELWTALEIFGNHGGPEAVMVLNTKGTGLHDVLTAYQNRDLEQYQGYEGSEGHFRGFPIESSFYPFLVLKKVQGS